MMFCSIHDVHAFMNRQQFCDGTDRIDWDDSFTLTTLGQTVRDPPTSILDDADCDELILTPFSGSVTIQPFLVLLRSDSSEETTACFVHCIFGPSFRVDPFLQFDVVPPEHGLSGPRLRTISGLN
jgi:hypothetical protein